MSTTADILTPDWGLDTNEAGQSRVTLALVDTSASPRSAWPRGEVIEGEALPQLAAGRDWAKLIDLVQNAARHSRDLENRAQEQELRVQELLQRVREDIRRAGEQVRVAELRAREAQAQAEASVSAAEERVRAAEARARTAEDWLIRVQDAIVSGFAETVTGA